uniref:hypothetical protein n=1 Tax=Methylibium sp. T29 TaxID=1430884 RepID=UPI00049A0D61|nr:hypothetical protein [Methylibium sp. T29]AIA99072.1 hypothetical protein T29Apl_00029 [Methylibium sp. T29]
MAQVARRSVDTERGCNSFAAGPPCFRATASAAASAVLPVPRSARTAVLSVKVGGGCNLRRRNNAQGQAEVCGQGAQAGGFGLVLRSSEQCDGVR